MARILHWLYWYEGMERWEKLEDGQGFPLGSEVYITVIWIDGITAHVNLTVRRRGLFFLKAECEATEGQDAYGDSGWVMFAPIPFPLPMLPGAFVFDVTLTDAEKSEILAQESRKINVRALG